ncbi:MAG: arginase, partial [Chitinophagaceae bacterium]
DEVTVLGHFDIKEPVDTSESGLRAKVNEIDQLVWPVIEKIVAAGKVPIIVGGGHNNVSPILAGIYTAHHQYVSAINIDAHADIRSVAEGRHSGNGFSAAMEQGYLTHYKIFGLHASYNNEETLATISASDLITATFFEDLLEVSPIMLQLWKDYLLDLNEPCALEIDLDSIQGVLASAATPSGFTLNDVRRMVTFANKKFASLHLCEGAVSMADGRTDASTAKTIAYLISDFIKAQNNL